MLKRSQIMIRMLYRVPHRQLLMALKKDLLITANAELLCLKF